ncbi:S8 family peptidase [Streptomyces lavendulae]|uniref:S8 family peptidase n=2 Tax=Streptomyces lavendulae TaxID=1914 RepID=UPI0025541DA7|nr:S8 family peptidase [Streptomyces lavendulae]
MTEDDKACPSGAPPTGLLWAPDGVRPVLGAYIVVLTRAEWDRHRRSNADGGTAERLAAAERRAWDVARAVLREHHIPESALVHVYAHALLGFEARLSARAAEDLAEDPRVRYVERSSVAEPDDVVSETPENWGLDRTDQRSLPLDRTFNRPPSGDTLVIAYVVDTRIRTTHREFGGRAVVAWDHMTPTPDPGGPVCHGHGTKVAGVFAGATHGFADRASIKNVVIEISCANSNTNSTIQVRAIDWVTRDAQIEEAPSVANMSYGSTSPAVREAIRGSVESGVVWTLSAGNTDEDACNRPTAGLLVAASTRYDARASFSNWGPCVDLFAPGAGCTSASSTSDTASVGFDGTSCAAPHVAGVAAVYRSHRPQASAQQVMDLVIEATTRGVVSGVKGSPNRLLYLDATAFGPEPEPDPWPGVPEYAPGVQYHAGDRVKADLDPNNPSAGKGLYEAVWSIRDLHPSTGGWGGWRRIAPYRLPPRHAGHAVQS